jgi:prepilin-type N-terminal cleavage/methylation domain-containing protein/prepilin-type processing-associated H-X9-DG protein
MLVSFASRRRAARRGFTLIELLVVIAIIALLAAILFPVFARARENARKTSCSNNLKQIALGAQQYSQDYDEKVVSSWGGSNGGGVDNCSAYQAEPQNGGNCPLWMGLILPYTKSVQIYQCPSANRLNETNMRNPQQTHYGHQHNNLGWGLNGNPTLADFGKTADTIYFSDVGRYNAGPSATEWTNFQTNPERFTNGNISVSRSYAQCTTCPGSPGCCNDALTVVGRHLEVCNVAFLDGHVKAMKVSALTIPFFNAGARGTAVDYWDRN